MSDYIYQISGKGGNAPLKSYILRDAAIDEIYHHFPSLSRSEAAMVLHTVPSADVVPRSIFEQVKWERDTAIKQLEDLGYGFCEEVWDTKQPEIIRCGECTHKDKKIDYCHCLGITICERDFCSLWKGEPNDNQ